MPPRVFANVLLGLCKIVAWRCATLLRDCTQARSQFSHTASILQASTYTANTQARFD